MDTRIPNSASFKVLKEDHTLGTGMSSLTMDLIIDLTMKLTMDLLWN